jgi:hypothetical protein
MGCLVRSIATSAKELLSNSKSSKGYSTLRKLGLFKGGVGSAYFAECGVYKLGIN